MPLRTCFFFFFCTFDIKVQHFCFLLKQFFENVKKKFKVEGVLERVDRVTVNTTFFFFFLLDLFKGQTFFLSILYIQLQPCLIYIKPSESDREKFSAIQGEVLALFLDFPICFIHFNFSFCSEQGEVSLLPYHPLDWALTIEQGP